VARHATDRREWHDRHINDGAGPLHRGRRPGRDGTLSGAPIHSDAADAFVYGLTPRFDGLRGLNYGRVIH
jgi:hypothetical protein